MSEQASQSYAVEVFTNDDGGGGTYWLTAEGRSASEAVAIAESIETFTDGCTVERVWGRIEETSDGCTVTITDENDSDDRVVELWAVSS